MKIHFSFWACLAFFLLSATSSDANSIVESITSKNEKLADKKKSTKKEIAVLPGRKLDLSISDNNKTLEVNLSGETENLEWVIFQPKGEVISRISTSSSIDRIKVANLQRGKYVLMIRDDQNRTLFKAFELN